VWIFKTLLWWIIFQTFIYSGRLQMVYTIQKHRELQILLQIILQVQWEGHSLLALTCTPHDFTWAQLTGQHPMHIMISLQHHPNKYSNSNSEVSVWVLCLSTINLGSCYYTKCQSVMQHLVSRWHIRVTYWNKCLVYDTYVQSKEIILIICILVHLSVVWWWPKRPKHVRLRNIYTYNKDITLEGNK
jgi:hypothetical protein